MPALFSSTVGSVSIETCSLGVCTALYRGRMPPLKVQTRVAALSVWQVMLRSVPAVTTNSWSLAGSRVREMADSSGGGVTTCEGKRDKAERTWS